MDTDTNSNCSNFFYENREENKRVKTIRFLNTQNVEKERVRQKKRQSKCYTKKNE